MTTVQYRVTVPKKVAEKLISKGIDLDSQTVGEIAELYLLVKEKIPDIKLSKVMDMIKELDTYQIINLAERIRAELRVERREEKSLIDVISEALYVYRNLIKISYKNALETFNTLREVAEEVEEAIASSEKYQSLSDFEKRALSPVHRYFSFEVLLNNLFRYWIQKNKERLVDVLIEATIKDNKNVEELAKIAGL